MSLLYETTAAGTLVRVFPDRVEYRTGLMREPEVIPLEKIAAAKAGGLFASRVTVELVDGSKLVVRTGRKDAVVAAIQRAIAADPGIADELLKLAELRTQGVLTDREFARQKAALLARQRGPSPAGRAIRTVVVTLGGLFVAFMIFGLIHESRKAESTAAATPSTRNPNQEVRRLLGLSVADRTHQFEVHAIPCLASTATYEGTGRREVGYFSVACQNGMTYQVAVHGDGAMKALDCRALRVILSLDCFASLDGQRPHTRPVPEVRADPNLPPELQADVMKHLLDYAMEFSPD